MKNKTYRFAAVAAVLLAFCLVFMMPVGAATNIGPSDFSNSYPGNWDFYISGDIYYFVDSPGEYKLTEDATGIIVVKDSQDVVLTASPNVKLTGAILVKNSSVTITGMNITATDSTSKASGNIYTTLRVMEGSKIVATGNTFDGRQITDGKFSALFGYTINTAESTFGDYYLAGGSVFSNNKILGGSGNVINLGLVRGEVTVEGNTVEMKAQDNGDAFFKVYAADDTTKITVKDNKITDVGNEHQAYVVHVNQYKHWTDPYNIDGTYYKKIDITMSDNTYAKGSESGSDVSPFLYKAVYPAEQPPELVRLMKDDQILLIPGVNQTGVSWTGDAESGYLLEITQDGDYILGDGFTASSDITISNDVTLNLNGETITLGEHSISIDEEATFNVAGESGEITGTDVLFEGSGTLKISNDGFSVDSPDEIGEGLTVTDGDGNSLIVDENGDFVVPSTPEVAPPSSSGGHSEPGAYYNYPRTVSDGGLVEFGTSKVVKSVTLPEGSNGAVVLHIDSTAYWPLATDSEFTFDISVENLGEGTSYISFKIDESKLSALDITAADVGVYHNVNGEWVKLTVTYKIEEGDVIYTAETDSFSPFKLVVEAGAAKPAETQDEPVTPPTEEPSDEPQDVPGEILPEIPGVQDEPEEPSSPAPLLGVLAALGAAVVLRRK